MTETPRQAITNSYFQEETMKTKTQTNTGLAKLTQSKRRLGALLVALTSLAVLLSSCGGWWVGPSYPYTG